VRVVDGEEIEAFVETSGGRIFSAEADDAEVLAGVFDKRIHERSSYAFVPPCRANVDAADAADFRIAGERVAIEATDRDEEVFVESAEEDFSGTIKAILAALPIANEPVEEVVALGEGL
jgi:hypothetical protein